MADKMHEDHIENLARGLAHGDKFLAEELRSEMAIAYSEYKGIGDNDDSMATIVRARAEGYLSRVATERTRKEPVKSMDVTMLRAELELSEKQIDHLKVIVENWKGMAQHYFDTMKYWHSLAKEE